MCYDSKMNTLHLCIDSALYDVITSKNPFHLGVFEAPSETLNQVAHLWNAYLKDEDVQGAFIAYPMLKTIFDMLKRPGHRAFVFSTRDGHTLAAVRTNILNGEHVWFRWIDAPELEDSVKKQCLDRNIYGNAITVWSYC